MIALKKHNYVNGVCQACGKSKAAAEHFNWECNEDESRVAGPRYHNSPVASGRNNVIAEKRNSSDWFVVIEKVDGGSVVFDKTELSTKLRTSIIEGKYEPETKLKINYKGEEEKWQTTDSTLEELSSNHFSLRSLYQPVWSHALAGLKWGALIGVGLKLLDSFLLLALADPALGFMFLVAIGVCFIPKIGTMAVVAISIFMMKFSPVNFFLIGMVAAFTGALLGCLPGMAIGGIVGLIRKSKLPSAANGMSEPDGVLAKSVVLPSIGSAALIGVYLFVFNPWVVSYLEQS